MRRPHESLPIGVSLLLAVLGALSSCGGSGSDEDSDNPTTPPTTCSGCYVWKPLRIGGGGWLTGMDISADGSTRVVRADTYGAYAWESGRWRQLVTSSSMPAEDVAPERNAGVFEIRIAPGAPSRLYMSYRGFVYRSTDRGSHWTRTGFAQVQADPTDSYRTFGQKMAVDPANPDVVYMGTPRNGLFVTYDGGTSWQQVPAVPVAGKAGVNGIVFDTSSGTSGGRTRTVYAASYGHGVWRTTDAGATWGRVPGGPETVNHAVADANGVLYATSNDGSPNRVWRLSGGTWYDITPYERQYWHTVVVDPLSSSRVVVATGGGILDQSLDRGASWSEVAWNLSRQAADIPWLAWTRESYMSNGDMRFDPSTPNQLWFAEGIGVWTATVGATLSSVTWTSRTSGIEQLVANAIAVPPGGRPVLASWDRPLFYSADLDVFPSQHGPNNANAIVMGWQVDYAATDPSFVAAIADWWGVEQSCYSTNGGQTWNLFDTTPPWDTVGFGTLAVSTSDNLVWVPSNRRAPYYTLDRGRTWQKVVLPGTSDDPDGWAGLHWAYYLNRHIVAADRAAAGTFYMFHTPNGLYRSVDGGRRWTLTFSGEIAPFSGFNAKLKSVPGIAGHLFFTSGQQSGDVPTGPFMRSTDGGATWSSVPNVLEVHAFGFGQAAAGSRYPTIFLAGWVGGAYGIWSSTDEGQTWTRIGDFPLGSLDEIKAVEGDMTIYGRVYIGFAGSGYAYGTLE